MRRLKKPPRRLRVAAIDAIDDKGVIVQWGASAAVKQFRRHFAFWAFRNQKGRCAYCSLSIGASGHRSSAVDHFVRKGGLGGAPQWTYELYNLVLACERCNSKLKKVYLAIAEVAIEPYRSNTFTLYHPYLDKLADHIKGGFPGGAAIPTTPRSLSSKGAATISLFRLSNPNLRQLWESESQATLDRKRRRDLSTAELERYELALRELQGSFR